MDATYREYRVEPSGDSLAIHLTLENRSGVAWKAASAAIGWQLFDPETDRFIAEGHGTDSADAGAVDVARSVWG